MRFFKIFGPDSGNPTLSGLFTGLILFGWIPFATNWTYEWTHPSGYEVLVMRPDAKGRPQVIGRYPHCRTEHLDGGYTLIHGQGIEVITADEVVVKWP